MGNCLMRTSKVSSQDHDDENYEAPFEAKVQHTKKSSFSSLSKMEAPMKEQSIMKIKKVRFKTQKVSVDDELGDNSGDSRSGSSTVRIRVVMTQEELKKILSCNNNYNDDSKNNNTLEQLLSAVKKRGGRVSEVGEYDDGSICSSWRPALESIPEDYIA